MVKNNVSINLVKIRIKMEYGVSLKKPPKSLSDTGNPYHVASLIVAIHAVANEKVLTVHH